MGWRGRQAEVLRPGAGYRRLGTCGILHHVAGRLTLFSFLLGLSDRIDTFTPRKALISADNVLYTRQLNKIIASTLPSGAYFFEVFPGNRQTGACNPRNRQWQARRVTVPRRRRPSSPLRRAGAGQPKPRAARDGGEHPRLSLPVMTGQRVKELTRE